MGLLKAFPAGGRGMVGSVRKRRKRPATAASRPKGARAIEEENRLFRRKLRDARLLVRAGEQELQTRSAELEQSLDYQAAISNILNVISRSHSDVLPIFNTIVEEAHRLCRSEHAFIFKLQNDKYRLAAAKGASAAQIKLLQDQSIALDRGSITGRVAIERRPVQVEDVTADPEYTLNVSGVRTTLGVPLLRDGVAVGIIVLTRAVSEPFTREQVDLVSTFATQALIAIENARLFDEVQADARQLSKTVEELRALSEVTRAINSTVDLESVLATIISRATQISGTDAGAIYMFDAPTQEFWLRTTYGVNEEILAAIKHRRVHLKDNKMGDALEQRTAIQFPDIEGQTSSPDLNVITRAGFRALLVVPLFDLDNPVGALVLRRKRPGAFPSQTIELMQTFAAQSVLAIRNARLFAEVQERTNELGEALQQQTATADVLKVISRSAFDLPTILQTLVESAARLCEAELANIWRPSGGVYQLAASFGVPGKHRERRKNVEYLESIRIDPESRGSIVGRALLDKGVVQILDVQADPEYSLNEIVQIGDYRSMLAIPLLREGTPVGVIVLTRCDVRPFAEKQIELAWTFADQAVIAIENARLFDEVQAKKRDLQEALTYQTGSANILRVIASSPTDVGPVLKAIVESACELCDANDAVLLLNEGEYLRFSAHHGPIPMSVEKWPINRRWASGRAFIDQKPVHVHDLLAEVDEFPDGRELSQRMGHRSILAVPLLREGESIGALILRRIEVKPFSNKQIGLLQTFADQAVIAIGNVRMFEEVQARTEDLAESLKQQTATADVLKTISQSAFDLEKVLQTLVESAAHLCGAERATITRRKDGVLYRGEFFGFSREFIDYVRNVPVVPERGSATARALLEGVIVHIHDVTADPEYTFNEAQKLGDFRTILAVPMMREGTALGVIAMTRPDVRPFTDKQIELVRTFADQAAIAIENARLLQELRERTAELSRSLDDLRTAQDRLVQTEKLASLGQLTAGIAHEIKNPLNFVNNFSALSAELTGELHDLLRDAALTDKMREEVEELTRLLQDNLEKVVQHGKRADSIVKNMLLHSREGSGEQRAADVNALVDESLNLAYHGARAEKSAFNITLHRDFDASAGTAELFPQEITRALLNLISNGFYAAAHRSTETGEPGFEPTLLATTKNLGNAVEIRIRDNGNGIPAEVQGKMFNPFFTTKPAGEGTGLGLSMTHDIIVKQHGGRIDVATEPGQFTEFKIVLPRSGPKQ